MKTKPVVFVCTQMEAGGVQVRATNMLAALRAEGVDARLLFLYKKRPIFDGLPGVTTLHESSPRAFDYPVIFWRLLRTLLKVKPHAVVGFAHYSSPIACLFGLLAGARVRLGTQTNPPSTVPRAGRVLDFVCGMLGVYTANIAASQTVADCFHSYPKRYQERIRVIHNGIKPAISELTQSEARAKFGLDSSTPLVISLGRLSKQKNHAFALRAIALTPNIRYAIAGDGELRDELQCLAEELGISDRVTFVGEIPPADVADFLRAGDVFAFPSFFEAFGLAVAEAMSAGLPVICSDHPALLEVVGDAGIAINVDSPELWASTFTQLIQSTESRVILSRKSRDRSSLFLFDSMYQNFRTTVLKDK